MTDSSGAVDRSQPAVLVAGATGGVGSALVRRLAQRGCAVGIGYRSSRAKAEDLRAELSSIGVHVWLTQLELTDAQQVRQALDESPVPLTGVVYAAGPPVRLDYVSNIETEHFSEMIDLDLKACFNLFRASLPHLREVGGALLAITTVAVSRYATRDVLSAVPKAGVETLVKALAVEEGRFGVRANAVAPGLLEGEGMMQKFLANRDFSDAAMKVARDNTPLRRFGEADDIARAAAFLMSDDARWITGQILCVDGGYSVA